MLTAKVVLPGGVDKKFMFRMQCATCNTSLYGKSKVVEAVQGDANT